VIEGDTEADRFAPWEEGPNDRPIIGEFHLKISGYISCRVRVSIQIVLYKLFTIDK
jgi:hypothetical protein